ncbi:hypothetical protein JYU34_008898, partial [Plutella xylostella]
SFSHVQLGKLVKSCSVPPNGQIKASAGCFYGCSTIYKQDPETIHYWLVKACPPLGGGIGVGMRLPPFMPHPPAPGRSCKEQHRYSHHRP